MNAESSPGAASASGWSDGGERTRALLDRVADRLRTSALILQACGKVDEARRAERFATRIRLRLYEPRSVRRMERSAEHFSAASHQQALLVRALDGAISLLGADFGNVQMLDERDGKLTIVAEQGFNSEFLERYAVVGDESTSCGRAAALGAQAVIADVNVDPGFAPHRAAAAAAGFRAVQSTPLIDGTGYTRGVISTHFRHSHRPTIQDLQIMEWYAELIAPALPAPQITSVRLFEAMAARHEQSAGRHDSVALLMQDRARSLGDSGNHAAAGQVRAFADLAEDHALRERERGQTRRHAGERQRAVTRPQAQARRSRPAADQPDP